MNLLIVDDEPLIHVSLEYSLKEIQAEDVSVYHAYTGSEMLSLMDATPFDLVLVDIQLPGINGLTAIQKAQDQFTQALFYVMTSFSEFDYAREAVRLKVTDYLLKPLDPKTLEKVLNTARKHRMDLLQQQQDMFLGWLGGTLRRHNMNGIFPANHHAAVVLYVCDHPQQLAPSVPDSWGLLPSNSVCLPCVEGMLILLFSPARSVIRELLDALAQVRLSKDVTLFSTELCCQPEVLASQMHTILNVSPIRVFYGTGRFYSAANLPGVSKEELAEAAEWIELRNLLVGQQYNNYVSHLSARMRNLKKMELRSSSIEYLADFTQVFTGKKVSHPVSIENLGRTLTAAGDSLLQLRKSSDKIDDILLYINEHCYEDISITSLANHFGLSANYLSTLLKNRLGIKFTDHITLLRLARAKELLLTTNDSIREITKQVGYYSQSHFNKIFQEKEGCTPAEFRNNLY